MNKYKLRQLEKRTENFLSKETTANDKAQEVITRLSKKYGFLPSNKG